MDPAWPAWGCATCGEGGAPDPTPEEAAAWRAELAALRADEGVRRAAYYRADAVGEAAARARPVNVRARRRAEEAVWALFVEAELAQARVVAKIGACRACAEEERRERRAT